MKILAVTGQPILHSKSPHLFREVFSKKAVDYSYFRIVSDDVSEVVQIMKELELTGLNVTAPFKAAIIPFLDSTDEEARAIGAVNTIVNKQGRLKGFNTDHIGVVESFRDKGIDPVGKRILIIGAGGAGRASIFGLKNMNANVFIIDIQEKWAQKAASDFSITSLPYSSLASEVPKADILILAVDSSIQTIKSEWISTNQIVFDINYKPSSLTETAKLNNCPLITGKEMLINQAVYGYFHFFGNEYQTQKNEIKKAMLEGFNHSINNKQSQTIALTGFMGSGKTTIGKELAKLLSYEFIDCDVEVEKRIKKPIADFFVQEGEDKFREIETEVLRTLTRKSKIVLSCGGGAVIKKENRELLRTLTYPIWLYCDIETSLKRGNDGKRPLLNNTKPIETATNLFNQRKNLYASTCELLLATGKKTPKQLANYLYEEISKNF